MTSSLFRSLGCNNPQKDNTPHKNYIQSPKTFKTKIQQTQKLAYSFKKRKYVKKYENLNHSLKNISQKIQNCENNKEIVSYQSKDYNRFLISRQFSYMINPCSSKLKKSISTNSSSIVGLSMYLSRQNSFQKDNLRQTQKTQLRGAQSTVDESKEDYQKLTVNQEVHSYNKLQALKDLTNHSLISVSRRKIFDAKQNENKVLLKDKSEGRLLTLGLGLKRHWSTTLQREHSFQKIQEEQQERSPTVYQAKRINDQQSVFQQEINMEPPIIQSLVLIKIDGTKRRFDQMEIRSARSIKQSSSGDEFSEVLDDSGLTLGKRKFSLAEKLFKEYL